MDDDAIFQTQRDDQMFVVTADDGARRIKTEVLTDDSIVVFVGALQASERYCCFRRCLAGARAIANRRGRPSRKGPRSPRRRWRVP